MIDSKYEFAALDHADFAELYLESTEPLELKGKLSKRSSKVNELNTEDANKWAKYLFHDLNNFLIKLANQMSKEGHNIDLNSEYNNTSSSHKSYTFGRSRVNIRIYQIDDWRSQQTPIVDIIFSRQKKIEINIYDSNQILINLSRWISNKLDLDQRKIIGDLDKTSDYVIGILNKIIRAQYD